jgi:hypothetical protein
VSERGSGLIGMAWRTVAVFGSRITDTFLLLDESRLWTRAPCLLKNRRKALIPRFF